MTLEIVDREVQYAGRAGDTISTLSNPQAWKGVQPRLVC